MEGIKFGDGEIAMVLDGVLRVKGYHSGCDRVLGVGRDCK